MLLGKLRVLCIRYFSKTKSNPAKKITGQCCSTEMEFACENSANLEQETKTTKIVTYPLFPLASSCSYEDMDVLKHPCKPCMQSCTCICELFNIHVCTCTCCGSILRLAQCRTFLCCDVWYYIIICIPNISKNQIVPRVSLNNNNIQPCSTADSTMKYCLHIQ